MRFSGESLTCVRTGTGGRRVTTSSTLTADRVARLWFSVDYNRGVSRYTEPNTINALAIRQHYS